MRPIEMVVVHCSATDPTWMDGEPLGDKVETIRRWHRARGWRDVGYHWLVDRDGAVAPGRDESVVGAHVAGHNERSIGVCLLGGRGSAATDEPEDHYTPEQMHALTALVGRIVDDYGCAVRGHNEFSAKACPGFDVGKWWDE